MLNRSIDFEHLTQISSDILIVCSQDGKISYCNKKRDCLGSIPQNLQTFFGEKNQNAIEYYLHQAQKSLQPQTIILNVKQHIYRLHIEFYNQAIFVVGNDISEKKEQERVLQETTARLNFAERIAHIGYWEVDLQARKIFWSPEMFRIFDADVNHSSTKRNIIKEKIIKEDLPVYKRKLRELLKSNNPVEGRIRLKNKNGRITYCIFKADIIKKSDNKKIAGTFQDLSEMMEKQKQLEKAHRLAEQANREKSYFLAQASHDLRQPLQALNLFVNLLQEEEMSPQQHNLTEKITSAANSLNNMLNNLLDISQLEAGGVLVHKTWFNIEKLLSDISKEYEKQAENKGIVFQKKLCCQEIFSDALLIERIIRNYISNALKYAKKQIIIECCTEGCSLIINIKDDGPGIKKDEQKLIFDEFYQSQNIPGNPKNGTGLGLAIVKKTANLLDAEFGVDSYPEKGSRFWLSLDICGPNIKKAP